MPEFDPIRDYRTHVEARTSDGRVVEKGELLGFSDKGDAQILRPDGGLSSMRAGDFDIVKTGDPDWDPND